GRVGLHASLRRPPLKKTTPRCQGTRQAAWFQALSMQTCDGLAYMAFCAVIQFQIGMALHQVVQILPVAGQGVGRIAAVTLQVRKPLLHGGGQGVHDLTAKRSRRVWQALADATGWRWPAD